MEPLTLTLLGYPLSVFANLSYDALKKISNKTNLNFLKKLFLKAFYKSLDIHSELYDDTARKISTGLKKSIKKDEAKLLMLISDFSDFSTDTPRDFFKNLDNYRLLNALSFKIAYEFLPDKDKKNEGIFSLAESIIKDCFSYYKHSFLNVISERKEFRLSCSSAFKYETASIY